MPVVLPAENFEQLQYESETNNVSLNTRINQIIKDHLNWHSASPEAKMYYIPKRLVIKAINHLIEQQLSESIGSPVRIEMKNETSGQIQISFYTLDDLDRLLQLLGRQRPS